MTVAWFIPSLPDEIWRPCRDTANEIAPDVVKIEVEPVRPHIVREPVWKALQWASQTGPIIMRCMLGGKGEKKDFSTKELLEMDFGKCPLGHHYNLLSSNLLKRARETQEAITNAERLTAASAAAVADGQQDDLPDVNEEEEDIGANEPASGPGTGAEIAAEIKAARKARKFKTPYDETLSADDFEEPDDGLPRGVTLNLASYIPNKTTGERFPRIESIVKVSHGLGFLSLSTRMGRPCRVSRS